MNIVEQLEKQKQTGKNSLNGIESVKQVQLLLEDAGTEDARIARALGKEHSLARAEEELGKKIELENLDKAFGDGVFPVEYIKELCIKYKLRFLNTKKFMGVLDVQAIHKLKVFAKEFNVDMNEANLGYNYFILAPEECFKLTAKRAKRIELKAPDPALFYKCDDGHYRMIHKWGSDFTIFRRIKGLLWGKEATRDGIFFFGGMIATLGIVALLGAGAWWNLLSLAGGLIGLIVGGMPMCFLESRYERSMFYTENNWNSETKYS